MNLEPPLNQHLDSITDEARISRMWQVIREERHGPPPTHTRPRRLGWLTAPAVIAVASLIAWMVWPEPSAPAAWTVPAAFEADAPRRFDLVDGSAIELAAGTRLTTIESGERRFVTLLERGEVRFEVRPGGPRRWIVESGLATVEVVGTVFTVSRRSDAVDVTVTRGVVLVRGERVPNRVARLTAGQTLSVLAESLAVPTPRSALEAARSGDAERASETPEAETSETQAPETQAPEAETSETQAPEAETSETQAPEAQAPTPADSEPSRPSAALRPSPRPAPDTNLGELMAQASAARRSGDARRAAHLLRQASAHNDPRAALAAFTLGRIEMDELRRPRRARVAFRRALALGLPARLAQQAERRLRELR